MLLSRAQRASLPSGEKNERKKKTANLKVVRWNIRTMQDSEDRPQRRSAVVARELAPLDFDIAALSEERFAEQGSLTEDGACSTLFWPGGNNDERRPSGVGFIIKSSIARNLQNLPLGHSYRLMSIRLPIQDNKFATVLSLYEPTPHSETAVK